MKKIQALGLLLLILLSFSVAMKRVEANSIAVVSLLPSEIIAQNVGEKFTVNVTITNVTNLYAYDMKIFYNKTQLDALWCRLPPDHFLLPVDHGGPIPIIHNSTDNNYNATHNYIHFSYSLLSPEYPRSGSGVLFQVLFNAIAKEGPYQVAVDSSSKLNDEVYKLIPYVSVPAEVTVLPEFPTIMLVVMLMAVTLMAVIFGKARKNKQGKSSPEALG